MKYNTKTQITQELLKQSQITSEIIIRDCLHKLINDIPLDELRNIFTIVETNPQSEEIKERLKNPDLHHMLKQYYIHLLEMELIEYEVSLTI